jgi:putative heme-binding domain-containing protein
MQRSATLRLSLFAIVVFPIALAVSAEQEKPKSEQPAQSAAPNWIWLDKEAKPAQAVFFRKEIAVKGISSAKLFAVCDDQMTVYINGKEVVSYDQARQPFFRDVTESFLQPGKARGSGRYVIAVRARNNTGPAGVLLRLAFESRPGGSFAVVSDDTWRVAEKPSEGWLDLKFDDSTWARATVVAKLGAKPWAQISEKALAAAARLRPPSATPADQLKVAKDFKVELLYSVPKEKQGSWVNMCVDPKGRLIVSDQYGGLFRVTPSPIQIEPIPVAIGEAQGLLWAFDSLYVVVNRGKKYDSGLYRVRDTDGDGELDKVELLRKIEGGGEHGPHAVLLAPDGKSLYVVCGNHTKLTQIDSSLVPRIWAEDHLLPRMWDARGHAVNIFAPGGWIARTDPDGKRWDLVSIGYRNQYDAAFNRHGELFTYDSDMEWDMNAPWYRPTRVCQATSGSEFGWRSGTGVWPTYYPDNLPPTVDIGPGSPTGVCFGYGARFPAKYQDALYLCDWSYGKLYAVHLAADGASYKGEFEEFITGAPLPLTDIVVNPLDGAMYFATGGRRTQSGLYRVTYAGKESTAPSKGDNGGADMRALRRKLEAFHGRADSQAIETAWPYLGHSDRFIRFAARTAIEHQPSISWQERALAEKEPQAALTALVGLARLGDKSLQNRLLAALDRLDWGSLNEALKLELLRAYGLAFTRMGKPDEAARQRMIARFDPHYPAASRLLNAELSQVLIYLEAPGVVDKTLKLLAAAPTQEEQIEYIKSLRVLKTGWTLEQRKEYFSWFLKAAHYRGGHSFLGFIQNFKKEAAATLTEAELAELKPILDARPVEKTVVTAAPRPFVRKWTVDELATIVEKGLSKRDFDRGRTLFGAANCFACHRFDNEGGSTGPDLTQIAGRFSVRDLLESTIEPSKVISDQYAATIFETSDGRVIMGRVVNLDGDNLRINTDMLNPDALTRVDQRQIESQRPSPVSMMPTGLLDTFKEDEILDLMAYLLSRGDRNHKMFVK